MATPEHMFRDFLRAQKLKYTTERLAILKAVQRFGRPFEAEELLLTLRESDYRVSKATVYRTLKHLIDAGVIKQVYFGGSKQAYYDLVAGREETDHLVDMDTGRIIPFSNAELAKLRDRIAKELGFSAVSHRFQIMGRKLPEGRS